MTGPGDGTARTAAPSRGAIVARWIAACLILAAATFGLYELRGTLDKAHVVLVYLLIVLGSSAAGGRALGLAMAGLGFLAFDVLFIPPYNTFAVTNPLDWLVLVAFLITSIVAAQLLYRANATAEAATERAEEVDRLAALGAETLNAADANDALTAIATVIRSLLGVAQCDIHLRKGDGEMIVAASARDTAATAQGDDAPHHDGGSLGDWIMERGTSAVELVDGTVRVTRSDRGSVADRIRASLERADGPDGDGVRPAARAIALPLQVRDRTVGVLRLVAYDQLAFTPEQARLLMALAYYAALGAERVRLVAVAERAESERRVESLRNALLTAVSHDLRTPLTTIKGIAAEIAAGADPSRAAVIEGEADRMNALVGDLLDLSRIHAGAVQPATAVNTIDDLLGAALQGAAGPLRSHGVRIESPHDEMLIGVFDLTQALRVLVNLLDNAAKYSPPGSPIDVCARRSDGRILIDVMDRGPGVPAGEEARIFEPFYRPGGAPADVRGHGLGLSIARGLAEAQGSTVTYARRPGGGSTFTFDVVAAPDHDGE